MSNLSPTGSGAPEWLNVNGGSFTLSGHFGANDDYMLKVYIRCVRSAADGPTEIKMGCAVYGYWLMALDRHTGNLSQWLAKAIRNPPGCEHSVRDLLARITELRLALKQRERTYHGAIVSLSHALPDDAMQYFIGDELVGEIYGWTA